MFASRGFAQRVRKSLKGLRDGSAGSGAAAGAEPGAVPATGASPAPDSPEVLSTMGEAFTRLVPAVPREMAASLVELAAELSDDLDGAVELAAEFADIFSLDYDDKVDPVRSEAWRGIRDIVDEYAHELDMDRVQYVMERVVQHGAIHDGGPEATDSE